MPIKSACDPPATILLRGFALGAALPGRLTSPRPKRVPSADTSGATTNKPIRGNGLEIFSQPARAGCPCRRCEGSISFIYLSFSDNETRLLFHALADDPHVKEVAKQDTDDFAAMNGREREVQRRRAVELTNRELIGALMGLFGTRKRSVKIV